MAIVTEVERPHFRNSIIETEYCGVPWRMSEREDGVREFEANIEGRPYRVDFYDIRNNRHKLEIAKRIASHESFTAHGHGINGFAQAVSMNHPEADGFANRFYDRKPGRTGKIPLLGTPKMMLDIVDRDVIHPDFRHMLTRERLESFFEVLGTGHLVLPLRGEENHRIHRIFKTYPKSTSSDWKNSELPEDHWLDHTSVCVVNLPDRDWAEVADDVYNINPWIFIGITSMNPRRGEPAYNTTEGIHYFIDYVLHRGEAPYEFGIRDSVFEPLNIRSSHPQRRFAFANEKPIIYEHRGGHMAPEETEERLGQEFKGKQFRVRQLPGTIRAKTDYKGDINHGELLLSGIAMANEDYRRRNPGFETTLRHLFSSVSHVGRSPTHRAA